MCGMPKSAYPVAIGIFQSFCSEIKLARGSLDPKINKSALLSLKNHNFRNIEKIVTK